jgi:flavin reductase (DIM6/NTAB) family NADH-FMN oxidoreductase RutF
VTIDPRNATPRDIYQLMIGSIVPRPIAFVSSISAAGIPNLAPFSFFTGVSADPPVVCFCPMVRGNGTTKDTLNNIRETKEFVVNIVSEEIARQMNLCSGEYPPEVDEFNVSGLTPLPSDLVRPSRVAESPVQMECRLNQIVEISTKPLGGSMVFGEIVRFHLRDGLLRDGLASGSKIDPDKLDAIGRMGGPTYTRTRDRFDLTRPA